MGATGAVGGELLNLLQERAFPLDELRLLASERSAGRELEFAGQRLTVEALSERSFSGADLVLSSASTALSRKFAPEAVEAGAIVIDKTSAFRLGADVPLVVPEVNAIDVNRHRGIVANPNCVAIITAVVLFPLQKEFGVRRATVTSYCWRTST